MRTTVQHLPGKTIRRHVTAPPDAAPYFPDTHDRTGEGFVLRAGEILGAWAPSIPADGDPDGGYATLGPPTMCYVYYDDGTWECFTLDPYHAVLSGTWTYVT